MRRGFPSGLRLVALLGAASSAWAGPPPPSAAPAPSPEVAAHAVQLGCRPEETWVAGGPRVRWLGVYLERLQTVFFAPPTLEALVQATWVHLTVERRNDLAADGMPPNSSELACLRTLVLDAAPSLARGYFPRLRGPSSNFDFEFGMSGWEGSGYHQPTFGDNLNLDRVRPRRPNELAPQYAIGHQGDWWIGTGEDRPTPSETAGNLFRGGTSVSITSKPFVLQAPYIDFLLSGSSDPLGVRVVLLVRQEPGMPIPTSGPGVPPEKIVFVEPVGAPADYYVVATATGPGSQVMRREIWWVPFFVGRVVRLRIEDHSSGSNINVDDFRFSTTNPRTRLKKIEGVFVDTDRRVGVAAASRTIRTSPLVVKLCGPGGTCPATQGGAP